MAQNNYAIECIDIYKNYDLNLNAREKSAVKGLNLSILRNEVHGFLGHNGAGKTTTLKMILKLITPSAGNIKIFGQDINGMRYLKGVSYISESVNLYDFLTPFELIEYYSELNPDSFNNLNARSMKQKIEEALDETGLLKWRDTRIEKFSKGMRQRLMIAACIAREADILVLDEPESGLDPDGIALLLKIITRFKKSSKTVFFSSHHISEIEKVCDRVSIIKYGELLETINISEYRAKNLSVEERYLGLMRGENH